MAKKNDAPANDSVQSFFNQAAAEADDDAGEESPKPATQAAVEDDDDAEGADDGTTVETELEFGPGHPYYKEPTNDDDSDDDSDDNDSATAKSDDKSKKPAGSNKDNPDRFEYWQSQAAKAQEQNDKLMAMLEKMQGGDAGQGDPPANNQPTIEQKEQELAALQIPERPKKPENYNRMDAYSDPDSESFRYRSELDDWNETFADVSLQRDKLKDELYNMKLKRVEEPVQKIAQDRALNDREKKVVATLTENHNFTEEQARDFVQEMSKPETMSLDNLVAFYRLKKGVKSPDAPTSTPPNKEDNRSRRREAAPPIPLGSGAGSGVNTDDDDEIELGKSFGASLLNHNR